MVMCVLLSRSVPSKTQTGDHAQTHRWSVLHRALERCSPGDRRLLSVPLQTPSSRRPTPGNGHSLVGFAVHFRAASRAMCSGLIINIPRKRPFPQHDDDAARSVPRARRCRSPRTRPAARIGPLAVTPHPRHRKPGSSSWATQCSPRARRRVYRNAPSTDLFLDKHKPSYVGGIVEMANHRLYRFWGGLPPARCRTGQLQNEAKSGETPFFQALYADPARLNGFLADDRA